MVQVIVAAAPREHVLCIGIERAINLARKSVAQHGTVYSFEPAHELELQRSGDKLIAGVSAVEATYEEVEAHFPELARVEMVDSLDKADPAVPLVISARGIPPSTLGEARARGYQVVQGTCPFVVSQEHHATRLVHEGYDLVFCGSPQQHGVPRLRDIAEGAGKRFFAAERAEDVAALPKLGKVGVMAQTTQSLHNLQGVVAALLARCHEVKVVNSICGDSIPRQASAREVAARADVMVVLGESWGASRMVEECQRVNPRVYRAVRPEQLRAEWLRGAAVVGVAAGNAVPEWIVPRFVERIEALAAQAG